MKNNAGPISHLVQYMNYLQKGLAVHTDNLNRADIPGSKAKDMKPFADQVNKSNSLNTTNSMHMSSGARSGARSASTAAAAEIKTNKPIVREDELERVNDISTEYLKATRLYQKSIGLFKTILNHRG